MSKPFEDPRILRGMERQLNTRRERLDSGERSIGWKVGFGAPAAMERLGLKAPLVGFLTDRTVLPSGAEVSVADYVKPAIEPEIAVYLGRDLPQVGDRQAVQAAIGSLGPAFELADVSFPAEDVESILAGNIYNRQVILGPRDPSRAGCILEGLTGRVSVNAQNVPPVTDLQALTGNLLDIVNHVAELLSHFGETLSAGDVIITGSILPPLWVTPPQKIDYSLEPLDGISIKLNP